MEKNLESQTMPYDSLDLGHCDQRCQFWWAKTTSVAKSSWSLTDHKSTIQSISSRVYCSCWNCTFYWTSTIKAVRPGPCIFQVDKQTGGQSASESWLGEIPWCTQPMDHHIPTNTKTCRRRPSNPLYDDESQATTVFHRAWWFETWLFTFCWWCMLI